MAEPEYVFQVSQFCEVLEIDARKQVVHLKDLADNVFTLALPVFRHSFVPLEKIVQLIEEYMAKRERKAN